MEIGHNKGPSAAEWALETAAALEAWLNENPVLETDDAARSGKLMFDRAVGCLGDLEAERTALVAPLNEEVKGINEKYRGPRTTLEAVQSILRKRLDAFVCAEEARRIKIAAEARARADEARRIAADAEKVESKAIDEAEHGVLDAGVGAAVAEANRAFADFQKAERELIRKEADIAVRIGGGFRRALSQRTKETLIIEDHKKALADMGITEKIREAILKSAREYRRVFGELPDGIVSHQEKEL